MSESKADGAGEPEPVEIEWQFDALDLRPVERWLATLPTLAIETGDGGTITALAKPPRRLVDSYRDTDDWRIARAGFVVRTRRRGRHDEVTLKDNRPAEGSGLRQRLEVTEVLPPSGLDDLAEDGPVGRRLRAIVGGRRLREVLQVRTRRRPFALRVGGADVAEVALDDTMIVVGNGQRPMQLRRVEVEVQPDWLEALEPIVEQLRLTCGLQPARLSKFEAGLLALGEEIPGTPDLGPTEVSATSTMGDVAFAALRRQLAVFARQGAGHPAGRGSRRAPRHACGDTAPAAPPSRCSKACCPSAPRSSAKSSGGWPVCSAPSAISTCNWRIWPPCRSAMSTWRSLPNSTAAIPWPSCRHSSNASATPRADMLQGLDSVRWDRLAKGLTVMAQQGPARRSLAPREPAVIGLPALVLTRHEKVTKAAKRAKRSGVVTDFHALRIRCKRLRYALEFSSDVYGGRTSRFVRSLAVLQGELGEMQDAEVASLQLAALATGDTHLPAATIFVMGGVAERHRRDVNRYLKRLPDEVSRTDGKAWRELRELMERQKAEAEAVLPPARTTLRSVPRPQPDDEPVATPAPDATPAPGSALHPAGLPGLTALPPPPSLPTTSPFHPMEPGQTAPPSQSGQGE